jgi:cytochrome c peroxidase
MHDGRFWNLTQVFDHYSTGIQTSSTLDPLLVNKIPLTATDKYNLIYFLGTLSDTSFTKDKGLVNRIRAFTYTLHLSICLPQQVEHLNA